MVTFLILSLTQLTDEIECQNILTGLKTDYWKPAGTLSAKCFSMRRFMSFIISLCSKSFSKLSFFYLVYSFFFISFFLIWLHSGGAVIYEKNYRYSRSFIQYFMIRKSVRSILLRNWVIQETPLVVFFLVLFCFDLFFNCFSY